MEEVRTDYKEEIKRMLDEINDVSVLKLIHALLVRLKG